MRAFVAVAVLAVFVAACASASGGGGSLSGDVLTRQDLAESNQSNLYDVLKNHPSLEITRHPQTGQEVLILGTRGTGRDFRTGVPEPMLLVLDGTRMQRGLPDVLRDLELAVVDRVEILRPGQAGSRYGSGSQNGVLVVETRR
mgnify:CR=1 FL=1